MERVFRQTLPLLPVYADDEADYTTLCRYHRSYPHHYYHHHHLHQRRRYECGRMVGIPVTLGKIITTDSVNCR